MGIAVVIFLGGLLACAAYALGVQHGKRPLRLCDLAQNRPFKVLSLYTEKGKELVFVQDEETGKTYCLAHEHNIPNRFMVRRGMEAPFIRDVA